MREQVQRTSERQRRYIEKEKAEFRMARKPCNHSYTPAENNKLCYWCGMDKREHRIEVVVYKGVRKVKRI